jgi:alpha,alpha-trehalose phosphorylase (configuration-retaining)
VLRDRIARYKLTVHRYVPKPKPEVFRITKTNHNILQGVADPSERITKAKEEILDKWATDNAERFWLGEEGPLLPPSEGGAHVIIVDDPQMPILVKLAKQEDPTRPVIFRSHIQVRADLADQPGTPTSEVWNWVWERAKLADVFISHPVREFIPQCVSSEKVGYMPATTDWLDGLNKKMADFDLRYYIHELNMECMKHYMPSLQCSSDPPRKYIVQIARFDPAKGFTEVLASYDKFRRR